MLHRKFYWVTPLSYCFFTRPYWMQIYYLRSLSWTFWNVGFETIGVSNGFQGNTNKFSFVEELKLKFLGQFWFVLKNSRTGRKFWGKRECWRFGQHLNPSTYCKSQWKFNCHCKCRCCRAATSMWQKICRDEWGSAGGERLLRFTVVFDGTNSFQD